MPRTEVPYDRRSAITFRASEQEKWKVRTFVREHGYDSVADLLRHALYRQGVPISPT